MRTMPGDTTVRTAGQLARELVAASAADGPARDLLPTLALASFARSVRLREVDPLAAVREVLAPVGGTRVIDEVLARLAAVDGERVVRDLCKRLPSTHPEFLAHELVLSVGDPGRRSRRGVYTTPAPLAKRLVERVDQQLRSEFGLVDGLADRTTWAELALRHPIRIPDGVRPDDAFVRVLEPATGSGVFLDAVLRKIRDTVGEARWPAFAREHLARRLVGFELQDAARALARWNVERALEEWSDDAVPIEIHGGSALTSEIPAGCTVALGNPPFSVRSGNLDPASRALVEPYRFVGGERIAERGALRLEMHLQDDYVKFMRLAEREIERNGTGVLGLVTNSGYLDAPTLRGMRHSLLRTFDSIEVLDLGGSRTRAAEGSGRDENIFRIGQGVCTTIGVRAPVRFASGAHTAAVEHIELRGSRDSKLRALDCDECPAAVELVPTSPHWLFARRDVRLAPEYAAFIGVDELFVESVSGIVTAHDRLVVDFDDEPLRDRSDTLRDSSRSDEDVRAEIGVRDNAGWKLARARERFTDEDFDESWLRDYAYRPFDTRRILYHAALVWCDRRRLMGDFDGTANLALATCRQLSAPPWRHAFVTADLMDDNFVSNRSRERTHFFPLFVSRTADDLPRPNLDPATLAKLRPEGADTNPRVAFGYVYALLFSATYRERYEDLLRDGFPRVPVPTTAELYDELATIGARIVDVQLPASDGSARRKSEWNGAPAPIERGYPRYVDGRVLLTPEFSFGPVEPDVWEYTIGAYRPAAKYLRDRVGRLLSQRECDDYTRLIRALRATAELQRSVDETIAKHGGWPGAFRGQAYRDIALG